MPVNSTPENNAQVHLQEKGPSKKRQRIVAMKDDYPNKRLASDDRATSAATINPVSAGSSKKPGKIVTKSRAKSNVLPTTAEAPRHLGMIIISSDSEGETLGSSRKAKDKPTPSSLDTSGKGEEKATPSSLDTSGKAEEKATPRELDTSGKADDKAVPSELDTSGKAKDKAVPSELDTSGKAKDKAVPSELDTSGKAKDKATPSELDTSGKAKDKATPSELDTSGKAKDKATPSELDTSGKAKEKPAASSSAVKVTAGRLVSGEKKGDLLKVFWGGEAVASALRRRRIAFKYWYDPKTPVNTVVEFPEDVTVLTLEHHIIPALGIHYRVGQRLECWEPEDTQFIPVATSIFVPLARDIVLLKDAGTKGSLEGLGDGISQIERRDNMYQSRQLRYVAGPVNKRPFAVQVVNTAEQDVKGKKPSHGIQAQQSPAASELAVRATAMEANSAETAGIDAKQHALVDRKRSGGVKINVVDGRDAPTVVAPRVGLEAKQAPEQHALVHGKRGGVETNVVVGRDAPTVVAHSDGLEAKQAPAASQLAVKTTTRKASFDEKIGHASDAKQQGIVDRKASADAANTGKTSDSTAQPLVAVSEVVDKGKARATEKDSDRDVASRPEEEMYWFNLEEPWPGMNEGDKGHGYNAARTDGKTNSVKRAPLAILYEHSEGNHSQGNHSQGETSEDRDWLPSSSAGSGGSGISKEPTSSDDAEGSDDDEHMA